jgi:hypothetical protein
MIGSVLIGLIGMGIASPLDIDALKKNLQEIADMEVCFLIWIVLLLDPLLILRS